MLNVLTLMSFLSTLFCCNSNQAEDELVNEKRFPSCKELELVELSRSSFSEGETFKASVLNTCLSCEQSVYTGLMAFSGEDTLAIDTAYMGELTPENGKTRQYRLKVLRHFETDQITRMQMIGICDSIILDF